MKTQIQSRKLRTCLWIVNLLQKHKALTLREINQYWCENHDLNDSGQMSRQTFTNYRGYILDLFGIDIECNANSYQYYIAAREEHGLTDWLISSFTMSSLLEKEQEVRDRILFEAPPGGMQFFDMIVEAMHCGCSFEMTYQKFNDDEPYICFIEPYCLKMSARRWYLLARKDHRDHLQVFALDRIVDIRLLDNVLFQPEEEFSASDFYRDSFGVYAGSGTPDCCRIRLAVNGNTRNYLRTLPLHDSQKEIVVNRDLSWFDYQMRPTRDLLLYLLSQGPDVAVLEPESLRMQMKEILLDMSNKYL